MDAWEKPINFVKNGLDETAYVEAVEKIATYESDEAFVSNIASTHVLIDHLPKLTDKEKAFEIGCMHAAAHADRAEKQSSRDILWFFISKMKSAVTSPPPS